ncbi:D-isomer specific 2-hydroxyacid dehydrogenase [Gracilaria domingensis]|nr:D-isomer specific 2-hydroxyacid dehydrogenase [Gracilaria domingensis]
MSSSNGPAAKAPIRVVVYSSKRYERDFLTSHPHLAKIAPNVQLEFLAPRLDATTAPLAAGADAVCIFVNDCADEETIQTLSKNGTKCLLLRCAGFNQVDLKAAALNGVTVLRVPQYSPYAVAEFAVALLLTTVRKTHKAYNRTRESNFALSGLLGFDIHGKTVGVCGTGKIGQLFAKIMLGFGARVIAYDIYQSEEAKKMGVEYVSFDDLLATSDIISLHCPLFPSTKHMINAEAVGKMKKGVVLINTSRGELVDMNALIFGLRRGIIGGCGMDVMEGEQELFFDDHTGEILEDEKILTLQSLPNVLITPHIAFCTDTAISNIWSTTYANVLRFIERRNSGGSGGEALKNEVVAQ